MKDGEGYWTRGRRGQWQWRGSRIYEDRMVVVGMRMPRELIRRLDRIAAIGGVPRTALMRAYLEAAVDDQAAEERRAVQMRKKLQEAGRVIECEDDLRS